MARNTEGSGAALPEPSRNSSMGFVHMAAGTASISSTTREGNYREFYAF